MMVVAEYRRCTEAIIAEHHADDTGTYTYTVRILGGKHHGIEFHCRTAESTTWLFDLIVAHRKNNTDWAWLA